MLTFTHDKVPVIAAAKVMPVVIVIWSAIILLGLCLVFPPYGYSHYKTTHFMVEHPDTVWTGEERSPWRYLCHRFILSAPPETDPRLPWKDNNSIIGTIITDMGIGWHLVFIEMAIVIFAGAGVAMTLLLWKKSKTLPLLATQRPVG